MESLPALAETQIESLISQAIDKLVPVESLERLLNMRKELKAEYAKEQFDLAMSSFQSECPIIVKTKSVYNNQGRLLYKFAPLDSIASQVKKLLKTYGFSYSMQTETLTNGVKAICLIKHIAGHSETASVQLPLISKTAAMSDSQVVEGTLTIAKRLAFCNGLGILTSDQDYNGNIQEKEMITEDQIINIQKLLSQTQYTEKEMCISCNVESIIEIERSRANQIIVNLEKLIEKNRDND